PQQATDMLGMKWRRVVRQHRRRPKDKSGAGGGHHSGSRHARACTDKPRSPPVKENITVQALLRPLFAVQDRPPKRETGCRSHTTRRLPHMSRITRFILSTKESVMTWSSDRTSVLLYAILATLFVMSWIYVPALGADRAEIRQACSDNKARALLE